MTSLQIERLKCLLQETEQKFINSGEIVNDAIAPALNYKDPLDKEFAAFLCSVFAYGRIEQIKKNVVKLLKPLGDEPQKKLVGMAREELRQRVKGWKHRFNTEEDAFKLLCLLKSIYERDSSIEKFFLSSNMKTTKTLMEAFVLKLKSRMGEEGLIGSKSFWYLFPSPAGGSACKRLNLFLRWMVGTGPFDLALWSGMDESQLLIPIDVHLLRQAQSLKLTKRKQPDWKTAEEVTAALRKLDKNRPVRFDFALCHLGINGKTLAAILMFLLISCQSTNRPVAEVINQPEPTAAPLRPKAKELAKFTNQDEVRFLRAIREDHLAEVKFFLAMGIDVNKNYTFEGQKTTALLTAIESKSQKCFNELLLVGARADALQDPNNSELLTAIAMRQELLSLALIERGAQFNKIMEESGETALMVASRVGLCEVARRLLERGAHKNTQNSDGYTSLMYAAEYANGECVQFLLQAGADRTAKNIAGRTAAQLASEKLTPEIRDQL